MKTTPYMPLVTAEFIQLVITEREAARIEFGDDYVEGKQPLFLFGVLVAQIGGISEAILGDAAEGKVGNLDLAEQRCIAAAATLASLYELLDKVRDQFLITNDDEDLDEDGWLPADQMEAAIRALNARHDNTEPCD